MNRFVRSIAAAGLALAVSAGAALAANVEVNTTVTGLALRGYDPVAYFTDGKPVPGDYAITAVHEGATYRFKNDANKAAFEKEPAKYLPQYGGFCAFGAAMGVKVDGDPTIYKVVDGKLYLNLAPPVQTRWEGDIKGFISKANDNWVKLKTVDPAKN